MEKITNPETLESQTKVWEKIETIYPETLEVPTYDYGNSQNTLDYNIALRNKPSWNIFCKFYLYTWTTTWNWSYTWVWFKPKYVRIQATLAVSPHPWSSDGCTSSPNWDAIYHYYSSWWDISIVNNRIIKIFDDWRITQKAAKFISFDNDWFTLEFTTNNANNAQFIITCYG